MEEAKSKGELLVIANLAEQSERYEGKQSMGGGGVGWGTWILPVMTNTRRFRLKGVPIPGFRYIK